MTTAGMCSTPNALSTLFQGVVSTKRTATETEVPTRSRRNSAVWQPRPDLATAATAWLTAGGSHHTVLTQALGPEPLADFAEMAGIEFLLIDSTTTTSAFAKEVRWNEAYYRSAR